MPRLASQCADPKRFDSDTNFHFDLFFNATVRVDLDSDTTFRFDLIPERHPDKYFNKFK